MKLSWVLLGLLVAMWLVLLASLWVPADPRARGMPHATYRDMAQGGPGLDRHEDLLWVGWAFGSLQLILFSCLLAFGFARPGSPRWLSAALLAGGLLDLAVFAAIMVTYHRFLVEPELTLLGSFPVPTTVALFGTWAAPFYYVALYVFTFSRNFWSEENEKTLQALLLARDRSKQSE